MVEFLGSGIIAPDWKNILKKAWSVKFIILAAILTGGEAIGMIIGVDWIPISPAYKALIVFLVSMGALLARVVVQKDVK